MICSVNMHTPFGWLNILADEENLLGIRFERGEETFRSALLDRACSQLEEYFAGERKEFSLPYAMVGTEFQCRVWNVMNSIPYGKVMTYGEVAAGIGNSRACRAVGMACNRNSLPILIPCHRVVGTGWLGGFAPGTQWKKALLELEGHRNMQEH